MRHTRIPPLLLSVLLASVPALAGATETDRLAWRDTGHQLVVDANDGPAARAGLRPRRAGPP